MPKADILPAAIHMGSLINRHYTATMSERIQRKLAAILAADVVGYSRLMGEDEAGTLAALRQLRTTLFGPTVTSYNGVIIKSMGAAPGMRARAGSGGHVSDA